MLGGGDDSKDGLMDLTYSPARERRVVIGLRGVVWLILWFVGGRSFDVCLNGES